MMAKCVKYKIKIQICDVLKTAATRFNKSLKLYSRDKHHYLKKYCLERVLMRVLISLPCHSKCSPRSSVCERYETIAYDFHHFHAPHPFGEPLCLINGGRVILKTPTPFRIEMFLNKIKEIG